MRWFVGFCVASWIILTAILVIQIRHVEERADREVRERVREESRIFADERHYRFFPEDRQADRIADRIHERMKDD